jgi:hypothetical protein
MLGVTATFPTLKDYEAAALDRRDPSQIILRCHLVNADGQIVADGVGARSVDQDYGDINKALKMAIKSAMIDATLRMAGLSEIFTQDLEDQPQGAVDGDFADASAANQHRPAVAARVMPSQQWANVRSERLATERQVNLIRIKLDQAGIPESEFLEKFGISDLATLPFSKVNPALHWISGVAA